MLHVLCRSLAPLLPLPVTDAYQGVKQNPPKVGFQGWKDDTYMNWR
jgi:hypothetical protein